jgi:hypothetical protein
VSILRFLIELSKFLQWLMTNVLSDLALSLTKSMNSGEFTIVLILVVLCATVFFCHALLRLFLLIFRGDRPSRRRLERTTHYLVPGGYAVPEEPIPVVLAQDEEARGTDPEPGKVTPPAYGLWRGSVVSA